MIFVFKHPSFYKNLKSEISETSKKSKNDKKGKKGKISKNQNKLVKQY
jgi:hypothetical protein